MKGQMFIITMVFLTGLVVLVSQLLLSYSIIDVSEVPDRTGAFVTEEYVNMINDTIRYSGNCADANRSVTEMNTFLKRLVTESYHSDVKYDKEEMPNIDCDIYNNPTSTDTLFGVDMEVITGSSEIIGNYEIYRDFIIFTDDPECNTETGDFHEKELWCKAEDPNEDVCKTVYKEVTETCGSCQKYPEGDDRYTAGWLEIAEKCKSTSAIECPGTQTDPDYCADATTLKEASCSDFTTVYTDIDCSEEDVCYPKTCQDDDTKPNYGDITINCDVWACSSGACENNPTFTIETPEDDCQPSGQCIDTDGGENPNSYGEVNYYPPCQTGDTECIPKVTEEDSCQYHGEKVNEKYCDENELIASKNIDCDSANDASHGYGCQLGKCFDCDDDNDGWCECTYDGASISTHNPECNVGGGRGVVGSYDCDDSCNCVGPGESYTYFSCFCWNPATDPVFDYYWDRNCNNIVEYSPAPPDSVMPDYCSSNQDCDNKWLNEFPASKPYDNCGKTNTWVWGGVCDSNGECDTRGNTDERRLLCK